MPTVRDVLDAFRNAPLVDFEDLFGRYPVLVLAPHPDDESLGCGGFIAEATARGHDIRVAILTDGTGSHVGSPTYPPARLKAVREAEARQAVAALGLPPDRLSFLEQPDTRAPTDGSAFDALEERFANWARGHRIGTIITTWRHDPHCDHEAASKLAATVCRRIHARHLEVPVWGWTLNEQDVLSGPIPAASRLDISNRLDAKRRAIAAHRSQTTPLITDARESFQLPSTFETLFGRPWEVFICP